MGMVQQGIGAGLALNASHALSERRGWANGYKATSNPSAPSLAAQVATVSRLRQVRTCPRCERTTRSRIATRTTTAQASPWRITWITRTAPVLTSSRAVDSVIDCSLPGSALSLSMVLMFRFFSAVIGNGFCEGVDLPYHPIGESSNRLGYVQDTRKKLSQAL